MKPFMSNKITPAQNVLIKTWKITSVDVRSLLFCKQLDRMSLANEISHEKFARFLIMLINNGEIKSTFSGSFEEPLIKVLSCVDYN